MRSTFKVLFYLKRNAPKKSKLIPSLQPLPNIELDGYGKPYKIELLQLFFEEMYLAILFILFNDNLYLSYFQIFSMR